MPGVEGGPISDQQTAKLVSVGQNLGLLVEIKPEIESNLSLPVIAALPQSEYIDQRELFKAHQKLIMEAFERPAPEFIVDTRFTSNHENMREYLENPRLKEEMEAGMELVLIMAQGGDNPRYQLWGIKPSQSAYEQAVSQTA